MDPSPQEERFEQALADDPHDVTAWSAYADYLSERGDPRGEFMQVQRALEDESLPAASRKKLRAREQALLTAHEDEWVGDWPKFFPAPLRTAGRGQVNHTGGHRYEFRRGLLTAVHFGELTEPAARAFVQAPQTRFVRELFIGDGSDKALRILLRWPRLRRIRRFQFGWAADEDYSICRFHCRLSGQHVCAFVRQMPDLEELLVFAHFRDGRAFLEIPLPRLRVLQIYHSWYFPLGTLAEKPEMVNLTHLLFHPHGLDGDEPYIRLEHLQTVCHSEHLRSLTHLRLRLADFGDAGMREIVESGVLQRLKVLDLRHGCVTDTGARLLAACPDLRKLEFLDLSRNALTEAGKDALRTTGVSLNVEHQHRDHRPTDEYGDQADFLLEGDCE